MINLLGPAQKGNIRAARLNVRLRKLILVGGSAAIVVLAIYGVGFYFAMTEQASAEAQSTQDKASVASKKEVLDGAKAYKTNLGIAKKVLESGVSYSTVLTSTAAALPSGSVLTTIAFSNLGATSRTPTAATNQMTLNVRTADYETALKVKGNLEASDYYEKVSLSDVTRADASGSSFDTKYPVSATLRVTVTLPKDR